MIRARHQPAEAVSEARRYSEANIPTEYGTFRVLVYRQEVPTGPRGATQVVEHMAITRGDVTGDDVLVRVHSECWTGEVLHSLKCECREQLDFALRSVAQEGRGAVFYLRQEGRGIGLGDKIRAYKLQEQGLDTVDANRMLGLPDDTRRYDVAASMARDLHIRSVRLLTNNPEKVRRLRAEGLPVTERVPVHIEPNEHNVGYLLAKSRRMGHSLAIVGADPNDQVMSKALDGRRDDEPALPARASDDTQVRPRPGEGRQGPG